MSPFRSSKTKNLGKILEVFESRKIGAANLQDADKKWPSVGGGGITADWLTLVSGDSYEGGIIYKVDANTYQLWYYPESRTTGGISSNSTPLSGTFTVDQQGQIKVYGVGGGGGGRGENSHAGGGGGAFTTDYFNVDNGEQFTYSVGAGGRGGVNNTTTNAPYLGDSTNNSTAGGDTTFSADAGDLSMIATGGGVGNRVSNTTSSSDLGFGGTGNIPNNGRSITMTPGTGGTGGGRNFQAANGTSGGAGGGGANSGSGTGPTNNVPGYDKGGNGSGTFGGGGGGGNAPGSPAPSLRPGGSAPGTYAYSGGAGGSADEPSVFGQDGDDMVGKTGFPVAFNGGGGLAYKYPHLPMPGGYPSGWPGVAGSGGGGGFAGGGGGSSWYGGRGLGADGASGVLVIEWTV